MGKDNENCCGNCANTQGYGSQEGFYCTYFKCGIRGECYGCEGFSLRTLEELIEDLG